MHSSTFDGVGKQHACASPGSHESGWGPVGQHHLDSRLQVDQRGHHLKNRPHLRPKGVMVGGPSQLYPIARGCRKGGGEEGQAPRYRPQFSSSICSAEVLWRRATRVLVLRCGARLIIWRSAVPVSSGCHFRAVLVFARYHATVASMPSRRAIAGRHPALRNTEMSSSLRGVPSGWVGSQRVSPV